MALLVTELCYKLYAAVLLSSRRLHTMVFHIHRFNLLCWVTFFLTINKSKLNIAGTVGLTYTFVYSWHLDSWTCRNFTVSGSSAASCWGRRTGGEQSSLTSKPILSSSSVSIGPVGQMKPMCLLTTTDALDWEHCHKAKESCPCCFIGQRFTAAL